MEIIGAIFLFACLLGASLQVDISDGLSGNLCAGGPGLWPVPADCSGFVLCVGRPTSPNAAVGRLLRCPPSTAFSAQLHTCVPASQVAGCRDQTDEVHTGPIHIHVPSRQRRAEVAELAVAEEGCNAGILGPTCADCDRLVVCGQLNGRVTSITSVSCSSIGNDYICSGNKCISNTSSIKCKVAQQPPTFRCLEPGIFPDPEDCSRYHLCGADLGHISDTCDGDYDPKSKSCLDSPEAPANRTCKAPVNCENDPDEMRALPNAPAYYALCLPSLQPANGGATPKLTYHISVLSCPEGQIYDDKLKKCRLSCASRGRVPVEGDCRAYKECTAVNAEPQRQNCGRGLAFHAVRRMCLPESQVPACSRQENITSPPRVTSQATTATSQTKLVASSQIQTTPVTPAITNSTPVLQQTGCITEGRFIDRSNCRRYVHCWRGWDGALTMALRWCPLFTYFDPTFSTCRIGFC